MNSQCCNVSMTAPASPPDTTGRWKTDPAEARTVLGLVGSTDPSQWITAPIPAASAVRIMVPALPGSRTSTRTITEDRSLATSSGAGTKPTTARTGWGWTVSATRSITPGPRSKTRTPAAKARSTTPATPSLARPSGAT